MNQISVVRIGTETASGAVRFHIGRFNKDRTITCTPAHALSNPFFLKEERERLEILEKFKSYFYRELLTQQPFICESLRDIFQALLKGNVELECFCAPRSCHGDIVKDFLDLAYKQYMNGNVTNAIANILDIPHKGILAK